MPIRVSTRHLERKSYVEVEEVEEDEDDIIYQEVPVAGAKFNQYFIF